MTYRLYIYIYNLNRCVYINKRARVCVDKGVFSDCTISARPLEYFCRRPVRIRNRDRTLFKWQKYTYAQRQYVPCESFVAIIYHGMCITSVYFSQHAYVVVTQTILTLENLWIYSVLWENAQVTKTLR